RIQSGSASPSSIAKSGGVRARGAAMTDTRHAADGAANRVATLANSTNIPSPVFFTIRGGEPWGSRFAPDSPLEGAGFEPSVPGTKEPVFVAEGELRDRTGAAKKGCFLCGTDGSNPSPSSGEMVWGRRRRRWHHRRCK